MKICSTSNCHLHNLHDDQIYKICCVSGRYNTTTHFRHLCMKTNVLSCHRCLKHLCKNEQHLNNDQNFDYQMQLSKSNIWFYNNSLHFSFIVVIYKSILYYINASNNDSSLICLGSLGTSITTSIYCYQLQGAKASTTKKVRGPGKPTYMFSAFHNDFLLPLSAPMLHSRGTSRQGEGRKAESGKRKVSDVQRKTYMLIYPDPKVSTKSCG